MTGFTDKRRHLCSEKFNEPVYSQNVCFRICRWRTSVWLNLVKMVVDLLTIAKNWKTYTITFTNFIQILFHMHLNRMWDIWSFFFRLCPTFHTNSDPRYYIFTTAILTNPTIVFAFWYKRIIVYKNFTVNSYILTNALLYRWCYNT